MATSTPHEAFASARFKLIGLEANIRAKSLVLSGNGSGLIYEGDGQVRFRTPKTDRVLPLLPSGQMYRLLGGRGALSGNGRFFRATPLGANRQMSAFRLNLKDNQVEDLKPTITIASETPTELDVCASTHDGSNLGGASVVTSNYPVATPFGH